MTKRSKVYVVKITRDEDGVKRDSPKWCYVTDWSDSRRTLCSGEVFGYGEGSAEYQDKEGYITCPECIARIKELQSIKL